MSQRGLYLGIAFTFLVGGCVDNRATFFVQQINVPSADCIVEADGESLGISSGFVDLVYADTYMISPLMRNQMSPMGSEENLVAETNGITVEGANIRIWRGGLPEGEPIYSFYQPAVAYVPPGGLGIVSFVAIPSVAMDAILSFSFPGSDPDEIPVNDLVGYEDLVTVGVRLMGTTNGNKDVETPEFNFPVHLCFGCLTVCPPESGDVENDIPLCENSQPAEQESCYLGVDSSVDCRYCVTVFGPILGDEAADFCVMLCGF